MVTDEFAAGDVVRVTAEGDALAAHLDRREALAA